MAKPFGVSAIRCELPTRHTSVAEKRAPIHASSGRRSRDRVEAGWKAGCGQDCPPHCDQSCRYSRTMPLKEAVCGPALFARMVREQLQKPDDSKSCRLHTASTRRPVPEALVFPEQGEDVESLRGELGLGRSS